ncbi:MAG: PaaI family thioesterase [Proteobacteria bacterium]|nr:PaaI family thioesterase [Pseudomonadota bacterium]
MSDERESAEQRGAASNLAQELRGVIEALAVLDLDTDALCAATERARELRRELAGPVRERWYEGGGPMPKLASHRRAYLDQSPTRGRLNPVAPPISIRRVDDPERGPAIEGRARLGRAYEGPPHGVHGGWVAALFDEVLGSTQGFTESAGMTGKLTVRYRHVTPLEEELRFLAWIHLKSGRRVVARATCHAGDTLTAEAEGLFLPVDFSEVEEQMRGRRR